MKIRTKNDGFSLIEVAIALLIIGLISGPLINEYVAWKNSQLVDLTVSNDGVIRSALRKYAQINGCYPVPAPPNVNATAAGAGVESVPLGGRTGCTDLTAGQLAAIPVCTGNDLVVCQTPCLTTGGSITCTAGSPAILIGDVPFATLGLPKQYVADGFRNKFKYAVTASLTGVSTFDNDKGAVQVGDLLGHSGTQGATLTPATNAHYAIVSHGRDGLGAFSIEGSLLGNCAAIGMDRENCNNDGYFDNGFGVYTNPQGLADYKRQETTPAGPSHFDDFVNYDVTLNTDIWTKSTNSNILSNTGAGNVLVAPPATGGPTNPQAKVDVRGDVSADRLWTDNLCDTSGNSYTAPNYTNKPCVTPTINPATPNGFSTDVLTKTPNKVEDTTTPGIHCGAGATAGLPAGVGYAMEGIVAANEDCADASTLDAVDTSGASYNLAPCPAGEYPYGVQSGALLCKTP